MKHSFWLLSALALIPIFAAVGLAQTAPAPTAKPAAPASNQFGNVTIRNAPTGEAIYDDRRGVVRITDDVRVTQAGEDFILYADDVVYSRPSNQAVATKNLRVETRDTTIRGLKMNADFNTKMIVMTGNIVITSHGEKDGISGARQTKPTGEGFRGKVLNKGSKLTCDRAEWDYETRQAVLTGNILMTQGDNFGTCDKILFDEPKNYARLLGNARFTNGNQTIRSNEIRVWMNEDKAQSFDTVLYIPNANKPDPKATPRPTRIPTPIGDAPSIPDDILSDFNAAATPAPTPTPKSTPTPQPTEKG